jgi:VWFA-related protein
MDKKSLSKKILGLLLIFFPLALIPQTNQQPAALPPIEVPVRVLFDGQFVDNLSLDDFEIFEDGNPQKIDACYLVKGINLEKIQGETSFPVNLSRHYYLLFQTNDYDPKLAEAVDYLFNQFLLPEDMLTLMTPMKTYNLSREALKSMPKEKLSKDMKNLLKKDIQEGNGEYNLLLKDLKKLVKVISAGGGAVVESDMETDSTSSEIGLELTLSRYKETLAKLENVRLVDDNKFINFARALKRLPGQKIVFLFYQREFRPEISSTTLNMMLSEYQDQPNILGDVMELFQVYSRKTSFKIDQINQAFADASICFNLIFMNKESQYFFGLNMREQSEDLFRGFSDTAQATGGIVDNSPNPGAGFKKAAETSEKYYLLYYTPANYAKNGNFKNIKVAVKNKNYSLAHRLGYFAN